ncbi:DUF221-domain-containing protein [Coleophoma cylindrospora]|uniref:DUF221-domain-containing protein n=1 Tax=Coleophoma cylindrospora TaxID=1849047 RepID=A0A3D8QFQ6_9HELO|nr:DUF221-domain-containing protein [Coleophoma cylindrospora]
MTILFLIFRKSMRRVYQPRTYIETLREDEKTEQAPSGLLDWLSPFRNIHDTYVLQHQSLDGYLYLRYLKMMTVICFVGCCITWPVLFPVNATGGGIATQFDILSFSNVMNKNRYYAHTFIAWIFLTFVMYVISRETVYFINLRHAYLLAPFNAARISSRTVLFTFVPEEYLNSEKLRELFGSSMKRSWVATDVEDLEEKVKNRDKAANKLENAEIKLCKTANDKRLKAEKKEAKAAKKGKGATAAEPTKESSNNDVADVESGSVASKWLDKKDRPTHRTGTLGLIGKKVDSIEWARSELGTLSPEIEKEQALRHKGEGKAFPSVFVEFTTQAAAEAAFRRMTPSKAPHMDPRAVGAVPDEIIWNNLKMGKSTQKARMAAATTFIVLMIIFWAIPVAVVGCISNINYLTEKVTFLSFINKCPKVILGLITGLLPSVALSILMALVPIVCRLMAKLGGEVTTPNVELKCQSWYFAFQVIQVFLVTTFSSGASSVVSEIIKQPSSATTLLATSLPKASNFYISYIIVQGLGIAAGNLLNIGALAMLTVVGKFLDKTPRKMFKRYITLAGLGWGSLYPKFANLGVIAIAYAAIAPLVLGFATIGLGLVYVATRYNALYVLTNNIDTKGRAYARGLQQLMVGVYISEVCLIGLFAINTAPGPLVLMIIFLVFTALYHATMRHALRPLTLYLPDTLEHSTSLFSTADHKSYDVAKAGGNPIEAPIVQPGAFGARKSGFLARMFDPSKFKSFHTVQSLVPTWGLPHYLEEDEDRAFYNPAIVAPAPICWIVRDEMGISRQEVKDSSPVVTITDEYARFNEKGKVVWDTEQKLDAIPVYEKRIDY